MKTHLPTSGSFFRGSPEGQVTDFAPVFVYSVLFFFFFELLTGFIAAVYAFGLLGVEIPPEIASVAILLAPFLLLFLPGGLPEKALVWSGELALFCGAGVVFLDTRGQLLLAGLGAGALLVFIPALFSRLSRQPGQASFQMGLGLAFSLLAAILSRSLASGVDLTTLGFYRLLNLLLALPAGFLLYRGALARQENLIPSQIPSPAGPAPAPPARASVARLAGLTLGVFSVWILLDFAFAAPNVIARWSEASYFQVTALLVLSLALVAGWFASRPTRLARLSKNVLAGGCLLFSLSLVGTLLAYGLRFPQDPGAYPILQPPGPPVALLFLILTLLLTPVLLLSFIRLAQALLAAGGSPRGYALAFGLGAVFLLVMIFAHVFTSVYSYIPVIGPYFRDRFWLVYLLPAGLLTLACSLLPVRADASLPVPATGRTAALLPGAVLAFMALAALAGIVLMSAQPTPPAPQAALRVLTYNIQQGYNAAGQRDFEGQLDVLRAAQADIIGLQETDLNRISGGNSDLVRFLADRLGLYSYYGPRTTTGTFGIALLSRYPLENPRTYYLYSVEEQTALIAAQVRAGEQVWNVFVTHLGNGGPLVQEQNALALVGGQPHALFMGDFNFRPGTDQYRLTVGLLRDAWVLGGEAPAPGFDPSRRIDHLFISPDLGVQESRYLTGPHSDHPALLSVVGWQ